MPKNKSIIEVFTSYKKNLMVLNNIEKRRKTLFLIDDTYEISQPVFCKTSTSIDPWLG